MWDYYNKYKINVFIYDVRNVILCVVDVCDSYKYKFLMNNDDFLVFYIIF